MPAHLYEVECVAWRHGSREVMIRIDIQAEAGSSALDINKTALEVLKDWFKKDIKVACNGVVKDHGEYDGQGRATKVS